jgi:hypothetical protein
VSKGPGKQQRRILAALEKHPVFFLAELPHAGRTEMVSLLRAAWKLYDARKIDIWTYSNFGHRVAVCRVGHKPGTPPGKYRFLSVEPVTQAHSFNTCPIDGFISAEQVNRGDSCNT